MRAADKTIAFVKEWIAGTYTKRQYQNYYIVKTPHAQFLMKQTENRELLAIKDTTGHIYVFDNALSIYDYSDPRIIPTEAMSNPFLCLIEEGYDFKYTRVNPQSIHRMAASQQFLNTISKWQTLDRVEVSNPYIKVPVYLSLVAAGDLRLFISPEMTVDNRMPMTLMEWVSHKEEMEYKFKHPWTQYEMSELYSNKINSIEEIKGNYLTLAVDKIDKSWVSKEGWVYIPTDYDTVEEITGQPFNEARASRPNPYAYGIPFHAINLQNLYRRFETIDENAEAIRSILNLREDFDSSNWKQIVSIGRIPEVSKSLIDFFEADDIWLREHFEIAKMGTLEAKFRSKVSLGLGGALVHVNFEPNLTPLRDHVIYAKAVGFKTDKFVKIMPAPATASRVKGIFNDNY